ncbi:Ionotropic receptor 195 [Blattella germanica]|nr:Ionotropic receptor 195 [Blattella germanica]
MSQSDMYIPSLIADFFLSQKIKQVVLFVCWNTNSVQILKDLSERGLSVSVPPWSDNTTSIGNGLMRTGHSVTIGAVLDISCISKGTLLMALFIKILQIHWLLLFTDQFKWNHLLRSTAQDTNQLNLSTSSVTVAMLDCYPLIPLFKINSLDKVKQVNQSNQLRGYWSSKYGLKLVSNTLANANDNMPSLSGAILNVTAVSPFTAHQNRQMYDSALLQLLMEILDFRLQEVESRGRFRKSTDLWLLQQLMSGHIDISASSILVTHDRVGLAEYTIAVEKFIPQLYYKVQSVRAARNIYILPFSIRVWATLCSLLLAITIALTFILRRETKLRQQRIEISEPDQSTWEFSEVFLVTIGAVCQQGSDRNPTTSAARTLFIVLFALAVLTYTAYSASIISLLSSPSSVTSTLQGILRHGSKMGLALLNIHYYHSYFKNEDNFVSRKLHQIEVSPSFLELPDGLESTVKGEVAFCADKVEAHTYLHHSHQSEDTLCSIGEIPLLKGPEYQRAFALPLNSPYTKTLNYGLLRLMQFGLLARERRMWFEVRTLCDSPEPPPGTSYLSIALDDIYPALYLISFGLACACALVPLESIFHFCLRIYRKKYKTRKTAHNLIARQRVMRMMYNTQRHQQTRSVWWISRAWQRLLRSLTNEPFPFVH